METVDHNLESRWGQKGSTFWNYHIIEVLVFLFLIVPSMVLSFQVQAKTGVGGFPLLAGAIIVRDLALAALVFYFIWRNGESLRQLGLTWKNGWSDFFLGIALFLPFVYVANLLESFLRKVGLSVAAGPPSFLAVHGFSQIVLAFILVVVVALTEETIFRGYLLLRFQAAHIPSLIAAVLSSVIFSLGHGYEGTAGVITVFYMGLVFALLFLWRGSLVAPIIMHFLQDFAGIILPAMLH